MLNTIYGFRNDYCSFEYLSTQLFNRSLYRNPAANNYINFRNKIKNKLSMLVRLNLIEKIQDQGHFTYRIKDPSSIVKTKLRL